MCVGGGGGGGGGGGTNSAIPPFSLLCRPCTLTNPNMVRNASVIDIQVDLLTKHIS